MSTTLIFSTVNSSAASISISYRSANVNLSPLNSGDLFVQPLSQANTFTEPSNTVVSGNTIAFTATPFYSDSTHLITVNLLISGEFTEQLPSYARLAKLYNCGEGSGIYSLRFNLDEAGGEELDDVTITNGTKTYTIKTTIRQS